MIYADENYYHNNYLLGRKPVISAGFDYYARSASQMIDQDTFGRLIDLDEIPTGVQMCCCELAESEYRREKLQKDSGGKTAEKVGTYSVSFGTGQEAASAAGQERRDIIMKWLGNSGLCYQGV